MARSPLLNALCRLVVGRCAALGFGLLLCVSFGVAGCDSRGETIPEFCEDLAERIATAGAACSPAYTIDVSKCHLDSLEMHHCLDDCLAVDICDEACTFPCSVSIE